MIRVLCLLLAACSLGYAQECGTTTPFGPHDLAPPVAYSGGSNSVAGCDERFQCSSSSVLNSGNTASAAAVDLSDPNYLANFVAWDSSITRPYVTFQFATSLDLNRVELYFLHYPELNIGLPNMELFRISVLGMTSGGIPVPVTLANNQDLSSSDMRVRRVTLLFNSGAIEQRVYRLDMSFSGLSNTDWVLLSEIRFCNLAQAAPSGLPTPQTTSTAVTATAQDISSGAIELNCTIASAGSFQWEWMREGSSVSDGKFTLTTALSGRMSVLTISNLDPEDSGTYTCQVNRVGNTAATASQSIALSVPAETDPPTTTQPSTSTASTNSTSDGSAGPNDPEGPRSGNTGIIVAVVVVVLLVIAAALIAIIIVGIVLYRRWRKRNNFYEDTVDLRKQNGKHPPTQLTKRLTKEDINWELSSQKQDPSPPPEQVYAMVDKKVTSAPPIPPQNFNTSDMDTIRPPFNGSISPSGSPKLKKLTKNAKYELSPNPIYESSDQGLNEEPENPDVLYAMPDKSAIKKAPISEPIYSEALDPNLFREADESTYQNDLHPYGPIYAEPERFTKNDAPLEITADHIREVKVLGLGQFGEVALARTAGLSLKDLKMSATDNDREVQIEVAVKKLKPNAEKEIFLNFQKEIKFMARLKDDNIVRLLAVCNGDKPFIVMEYMENGDLNQFLKKHSIAPSESSITDNQLPVSILVYMMVQISSGMRYLASLKYVHRDMATRNCLIGRDFVVKIADFGMSRSLYESSYYRVRGRAMLPIRWMATESFYGRFSEKTDVWSFGITMWEIFVLCKRQPFEHLDDQAMIQDAIQGNGRQLPSRPDVCPPNVYEVMLRCCQYAPEDRATFEEIFNSLAAIHRSM